MEEMGKRDSFRSHCITFLFLHLFGEVPYKASTTMNRAPISKGSQTLWSCSLLISSSQVPFYSSSRSILFSFSSTQSADCKGCKVTRSITCTISPCAVPFTVWHSLGSLNVVLTCMGIVRSRKPIHARELNVLGFCFDS